LVAIVEFYCFALLWLCYSAHKRIKELVCDALCRIRTKFCDANKLLFLLLSKSASCVFFKPRSGSLGYPVDDDGDDDDEFWKLFAMCCIAPAPFPFYMPAQPQPTTTATTTRRTSGMQQQQAMPCMVNNFLLALVLIYFCTFCCALLERNFLSYTE